MVALERENKDPDGNERDGMGGEIKEKAAQRVMQTKGRVLREKRADNDKEKTAVDLVVTAARDMFETARILSRTTPHFFAHTLPWFPHHPSPYSNPTRSLFFSFSALCFINISHFVLPIHLSPLSLSLWALASSSRLISSTSFHFLSNHHDAS